MGADRGSCLAAVSPARWARWWSVAVHGDGLALERPAINQNLSGAVGNASDDARKKTRVIGNLLILIR